MQRRITTTETAKSAVTEIQTVLAQVNETEDRSSTNLDTVTITFRKLVDDRDIIIDRDILRSATVILSDIQSWGMDDSSLDTLQNTSAEYAMCNYIYYQWIVYFIK